MNYNIKLNLAGFKHVVRKEKRKDGSEVECLIIPIDANHLYRGEKGMYVDITATENKQQREGYPDTHFIKQQLPKDVYSALSDDEKKATPIIGNMRPWATGGSNEAAVVTQLEEDDLPF